jgi:uncharacterized membrane protein
VKRIVLPVAALVALSLSTSAVVADLKLCNQTPSRVGIAVAYLDPQSKDRKSYVAEGWWTVPAQTCRTLLKGELKGRFYYLHAIDYDRDGKWAGDQQLCTSDQKFTIKQVPDCEKQGHKKIGFIEIDIGESTDWTIRLTDPVETAKKK